jgi:hypothetical protein
MPSDLPPGNHRCQHFGIDLSRTPPVSYGHTVLAGEACFGSLFYENGLLIHTGL